MPSTPTFQKFSGFPAAAEQGGVLPERTSRQLVWGLILFNGVIAALCAAFLIHAYRVEVSEARTQMLNDARLSEQLLSALLDKAGLAVGAVGFQVERRLTASDTVLPDLWEIVDAQRLPVPEIERIGVFDAQGRQRCGLPAERCQRLDVSDRPYWREAREQRSAKVTLIGPILTRPDNRPSLVMVRGLVTGDTQFGGVAVALIPLANLRRVLSTPNLGEAGLVTLRTDRYDLLLRQPEVAISGGPDASDDMSIIARQAIAASPDEGVFSAINPSDGVKRIAAYRRLASHPLYVLVGRATDDILVLWYRHVVATLAFLAALAAISWQLARFATKSLNQQALAQRLYDQAPCGYHVLDDRGMYLGINATELGWLACSRHEVIGKLGPADFFSAQGRERFARHFAEFARQGRSDGLEFHLVGRDGNTRRVSVDAHAVFDQQGRFVLGNSVMHDISARYAGEQARHRAAELEAQNRQLRETSRLKNEFVSNMSHELRTPLNAILGFGELLVARGAELAPAKRTEYASHIVSSGRHLLSTVDQVLDFAALESGRLTIQLSVVPLAALLDTLAGDMTAACAARQITMQVCVDERVAVVRTDDLRLRQILHGLVANAVKFSRPGGRVEIRARLDGEGRWQVDVTDEGIGISEADQVRLFSPFTQLSSGSTKTHGGTGIGLALVARLASALGGRLTVRSKPDEGSTFSLNLPMVPGVVGDDRHPPIVVSPNAP